MSAFSIGPDQGSKPLSVCFFVVGVAAMIIIMIMQYKFGTAVATTEHGQMLWGFSTVILEVVAALLSVVIGRTIVSRRWLLMWTFLIPLVVYVAYSVIGVVGFGASERITKSTLIEQKNAAQKRAVDKANDTTIALLKNQQTWLHNMYAKAQDRTDRKQIIAGAGKIVAPELMVEEIEGVADVQAIILQHVASKFYDIIDVPTIQLGLVAWLAFGLVLASPICFATAGFMWPHDGNSGGGGGATRKKRSTPDGVEGGSGDGDKKGDGGNDGVKNGVKGVVVPMRALAAVVTNNNAPSPTPFRLHPDSITPPASNVRASMRISKMEAPDDIVGAFLGECTVWSPNDSDRICNLKFHASYDQWAKENGVRVLSITHFRKVMGRLHDGRHRTSSNSYYTHIKWRDAAQESRFARVG